MPEVSVVIPVHDRAETVAASVTSVLRDHTVDAEVVLVDDGSRDETCARLHALAEARVRILRRPHAGIAAARNAGVAAARAPMIAFHDSDDEALPGRLARPLAYLRAHPQTSFVVQNGWVISPDNGQVTARRSWIGPEVARRLGARPVGVREVFRWNLGHLQGMCFRRPALDATGPFDESLAILDDLDLVLRMSVRFSGAFLDAPAFVYRRHAGGVSRDRVRVHAEAMSVAERLVRSHPEALRAIGVRTFRTRQARRHARWARAAARRGDTEEARRALTVACRLAPLALRYRLAALRVRWGA